MKKVKADNLNIERYSPDKCSGLSCVQVNNRINQGLTNRTPKKYSKSYLNIIYSNCFTFFNFLGLIVTIALIAVNSSISNFFFVVFYVLNTFIGIIQEIRAKRCIDKLSIISTATIKAIRDGKEVEILTTDIVLDEVIKLGIGSQIPTDSEILEGTIEVNESLLTGESVPIKKTIGDKILAGSFIISGICIAKAESVGKDNYVQQISAKAKKYKKPHSEIMLSLNVIIKMVSFVIVPLALLFMIKSLSFADVKNAVEGTSTVVIGMIPAGMFLLTSLALALGIIKLSKHKTLVRDLYSLEMLARVDTICFDKTGTITNGDMTVVDIISINENAVQVNDVLSSFIHTFGANDKTSQAIQNKFGNNLVYSPITTLAFNSTRKFSAIHFDKVGTYALGAPEFILSTKEYSIIKQKCEEYSKQGYRVLTLASSSSILTDENIPDDFTPVSLILLSDNIRSDAIETIHWFKENGVEIKVISGDNPLTVSEVSKRVGIENADKCISLEGLTDQEVYDSATKYTVFGRVSPEQKAILIKSLKDAGHVTAMTGDGVNDILALKEADCAISIASGSDAAQNVSHLVLLNNNFNSMPQVVYEGRRVINNVQSSASLFLMKTLFTMFMGIITLCLPYMTVYPFKLSNMIMLEVFVIGIPSFFLSTQPNSDKIKGKFINTVIYKSLPTAMTMVLSVLIIEIIKLLSGFYYGGLYYGSFDGNVYNTMCIYTITFAGIINLFKLCKPFNLYKTILFVATIIFIILTIILSFTTDLLALATLLPFSKHYINYIIVIAITLANIPILICFEKLCTKLSYAIKKINKYNKNKQN